MVSLRCKMAVEKKLALQNLHCLSIDLGKVEISEEISLEERDNLKENLLKVGLELIDDKKIVRIEKIKNVIIERIYSLDEFSKSIQQSLKRNYN